MTFISFHPTYIQIPLPQLAPAAWMKQCSAMVYFDGDEFLKVPSPEHAVKQSDRLPLIHLPAG